MLRVNFKTDDSTLIEWEGIHVVAIEDDYFHIDDLPQITYAIQRIGCSQKKLSPQTWYQIALSRRRDVTGTGPKAEIRLWFELVGLRKLDDVIQENIWLDRVRKSTVSFLEELDAWLSLNTRPTAEELLSMRHDLQRHIIKEKKYVNARVS